MVYGGHAPAALAVGDFTGNGMIDLAVADEDDQLVTALLSEGGGRVFAAPLTFDVGADSDYLQPVPLYVPRIGDATRCRRRVHEEYRDSALQCRRFSQ